MAAPGRRESGDATRAQIRGSSLLLVGQGFAILVNLAVQVLLVRVLSKTGFGAFAYALSLITLGQAIAGFGLRRGVSRFLPIYEEHGERAKLAGTLVLAVATVVSLGLAVVLLLVGLRGVLTHSFPPDAHAATVLAIMSLLAPLQGLADLFDGVFAVFSRPRAIVLRKFVYTPLMRLVVVGLLALGDGGATALAIGYVGTGAVGLAVYGALLVPLLRERALWAYMRPGGYAIPAREVMGFTLPLLTTDMTNALMNAASGVILGLLATAGDVAELRAVLPVSLTMTYVLSSFGTLFVPLASRLFAREESAQLNRLYWQTAVWTTVLSYPLFVATVGLAEPITLLLFGDRYEGAAPVLAVLAIGHFATAALGPNGVLLAVFGRVRLIVLINVATAALNLVLLFTLIPPLGALGAGLATTVTLVTLNVVRQIALGQHTTVSAFDSTYARLYVVVVLASVIALPLLLMIEPSLPLGAAVTVLASVTVIAVTRHRLDLGATFPELARMPLLRFIVAAGASRR